MKQGRVIKFDRPPFFISIRSLCLQIVFAHLYNCVAVFLNSINHFRGLAVLFVVAGHCFAVAGVLIDTFPERFLGNLISGGTFMYVLISGYLFEHHFLGRFRYPAFLLSKVRNLLIPYLVLTAVPILLIVMGQGADCMWCRPNSQSLWETWGVPTLRYLWTGRIYLAYWFIPFALLNFTLSPLHAWFARSRVWIQIPIFFSTLVIGMMAHKPFLDLSPKQALMYFTPTYLFGILCSRYRNKIMITFAGREYLLVGLFVSLAALEAIQRTGTAFGNYHNSMFAPGPIDLMMPQKLIMSLFFLVWLNRFELRTFPALDLLAKASFAIFFIHPVLIFGFGPLGINWTTGYPWVDFLGYFPALVSLSLLVALGAKKMMGRWSRFVTGW